MQPEHGTIDAIFILRQLQANLAKKKDLYCELVVLEKAWSKEYCLASFEETKCRKEIS